MKSFAKMIVMTLTIAILQTVSSDVFCGNKDRAGQAGAGQLLINPWARSSGWAGANTASATGLESMYLNISGMAFTPKTELLFTRTNWLRGSDISINAFGFSQRVGESGVLGLGIMSMGFGDIPITTVDLPEGGLGTYSPQLMNLGLGYARTFSNSIYGGLNVKVLSESLPDSKAQGVAFDAGIRYITGERDHVKFGISLKNVGPRMQYSGDGFSTKVTLNDQEITLEQRTEPYELPSQLNIGFSYDYYIGVQADSSGKEVTANHRITGAGNFQSNSFGKDQVQLGIEYGFKDYLMVRVGFAYEEDILKIDSRTSAYTGPTAGITFQLPMRSGGSIALDYSYRATNPFQGTHSIGARIVI